MSRIIASSIVMLSFGMFVMPAFAQAPAPAPAKLFCEVLGRAPGCFKDREECLSVRCAFAGNAACDCICNPSTVQQCPPEAAPASSSNNNNVKQLDNPLGTTDIRVIVSRFIRIITGISGSIALLMFVYGGFLWVTSAGEAEKVKQGKKVFVNATLGLIIIFTAYAAIAALFRVFSGASI